MPEQNEAETLKRIQSALAAAGIKEDDNLRAKISTELARHGLDKARRSLHIFCNAAHLCIVVWSK